MSVALQSKSTGFEFAVSTTHLKARKGPLMAVMRNEQANDLIGYIKRFDLGVLIKDSKEKQRDHHYH